MKKAGSKKDQATPANAHKLVVDTILHLTNISPLTVIERKYATRRALSFGDSLDFDTMSPTITLCNDAKSSSTNNKNSGHDNNNRRCGDCSFFEKFRPWILYSYSFVTVSLVAATVYGWPALRRELRREGSSLTEEQFGAIFTVGAWSTQGLRFGTGLLRDRFGTQRTCTAALLCTACGTAGMAWSHHSRPIALAVSMLVIGMGSGAQLCLQPVAGLFPHHPGSVLSSLSGAAQLSGLMFMILTVSGNRRVSFSVFSLLQVVLAVIAMVILPNGRSFIVDDDKTGQEEKEKVGVITTNSDEANSSKNDEPLDIKDTGSLEEQVGSNNETGKSLVLDDTVVVIDMASGPCLDVDNKDGSSSTNTEDNDVEKSDHATSVDATSSNHHHHVLPTAREQILSLEYILMLAWFSLSVAPLFYYVGSIGFQLENKGDDDGFYTNVFTILFSMAALFSPLGGWVADCYGLGIAEALGSSLSALAFFILSSNEISLKAHIVGLACYGVGRMTVFGSFFSHIGKRFGFHNYGTLAGCGLISSALLSLLQYPMIAAAADGYSRLVNILSGSMFLGMIPYFVWLNRKERHERRFAKGQ